VDALGARAGGGVGAQVAQHLGVAVTTESGLLSSCATPASSEPSAVSFSDWWSASRWRAIRSSAALRAERSWKLTTAQASPS
jgi:hypothetical protein